ncbi:MAG: SpoIIE family protein phosphatase [Chlorobi bacterium]|nr:SpoIIE family protein phosphatase [Chlorobiota bacterium]
MNIFKSISEAGISEQTAPIEKRRIILTNRISIILSFILIIIISLLYFKLKQPANAVILSGVLLILILIPVLNKLKLITFSKILLSLIFPLGIVAASTYGKINSAENIDIIYYYSPLIFLIASLAIPLIIIDYRKKIAFYGVLFFYFASITMYGILQSAVGAGIEKAVINPETFFSISILATLAFFILVISFTFMQKENIKFENDIIEKNKLLEKQKAELSESYEELQASEEELRQNSEELMVINENLRDANEVIRKNNEELKEMAKAQDKMNQELFVKSLEIDQQNMELEKLNRRLDVLSNVGRKIVSVLTIEDIIRTSYKSLTDLMEVTFFAIGIYNKEKNRIDFPGTVKDNETIPEYYYELTKKNSFSVWCLKNKDEIFINDLDNEYSKYFPEYPDLRHFKAQSFIYCPLFNDTETIGTVAIHHKNKNAFSQDKLSIMRNMATYISLAIQNAKSYLQIKEQMEHIRDKNTLIRSSLNYAKTIQKSMLPRDEKLAAKFNTEALFIPKDIVSGDFYWAADIYNRRKFLAAVDCTGHGVPGAFLSFIGTKSLDEIVFGKQIFSPKDILNALDENIKKILDQENSNNRDGMDVSLVSFEKNKDNKVKVWFSGAKRPLFYYDKANKEVVTLKGSRKSIGGGYFDNQEFEEQELLLNTGDILYIATDGFTDQYSSEHKRFGTQRFISLIESIAEYPIRKQRVIMKQIFDKFKAEEAQRDDVTVLITEL